MKKIIVFLLLMSQPVLASEQLPRLDITQIRPIENVYHQGFNGLDYTALMEQKLQHQKRVDSVMQSLVTIDEKARLAELNFNKYFQLFQKEEAIMQALQENLSLDVAHRILTHYKKQDEKHSLLVDERVKMNYMDVYLKELQKQICHATSNNKNVGISQILASYPCNEITMNLTLLCLDHQHQTLALHQNNMQKHQDELNALSEQKKINIEEQGTLRAVLTSIDALSSELLAQHDKKIAHNTPSVILLQSLYRMKLVQKRQDVIDHRKLFEMKRDVLQPMLEEVCDKVFVEVDAKQGARLRAAWQEQLLLEQQEQVARQAEQREMQKKVEQDKEALRLQEIVAAKALKAQQRKIEKQLEKEKQHQIIVDQENIRLVAIAKEEADKSLLDALILENRRKNVSSLVTLAENNITNISSVFYDAMKGEKPLSKAMYVVAYYVEQLGLSDFDKNKFFEAAVEQTRVLKGHNFQKDDTEKRVVVLRGLMQTYFESIIRNNNSCVSACSDEQAANLAKLHNLLVDFLDDKFDL